MIMKRIAWASVLFLAGMIVHAAPPEIYENPCAPEGWETVQNYFGRTATLVVNQPSQPGPFGSARISLGAEVFDVLVSQPTFAAPTFNVDEASGYIPICTFFLLTPTSVNYTPGTEWDHFTEAPANQTFPNESVVTEKIGSASADLVGDVYVDLGDTGLWFWGTDDYMEYLSQAIATYEIT